VKTLLQRFTTHWLLLFALFAGQSFGAEPLRAGIAVVDITPPVGYRMAGYFYERLSTGVHDPLHAKAIVFEQASTRCALVFCDLCMISPAAAAQARTLAQIETRISPENILIQATHTHTGPLYFGELQEQLHLDALAKTGKDTAEAFDYPKFVAEQIAGAIKQAQLNVEPVELSIGSAMQPNVAFNRRYHMRDGTVGWNPGKMNTNIVRAAGPIDPQINLLAFNRPGATKPSALITRLALHVDVAGGTLFSADYPYYLERGLRENFGDSFTSIFAQGTSGNINHIDISNKQPQSGFIYSEFIGTNLANTVSQAVSSLKPINAPRLKTDSVLVDLPVRQFTPAQVAEARQLWAQVNERKLPFLTLVNAGKIVGIYDRYNGAPIPCRVRAFAFDQDNVLVGLPSEVFVELGLSIKKQSPFKNTIVVELCDDWIGYIPTKEAFAEGNYEPTTATIQPGGGERLAEAAVRLLKTLKRKL
jgi:neutral ceramidase